MDLNPEAAPGYVRQTIELITMNRFAFELNQAAMIRISGEQGQIRARSEHVNASNQYLLAYKAADGRATENWFSEDQLQAA